MTSVEHRSPDSKTPEQVLQHRPGHAQHPHQKEQNMSDTTATTVPDRAETDGRTDTQGRSLVGRNSFVMTHLRLTNEFTTSAWSWAHAHDQLRVDDYDGIVVPADPHDRADCLRFTQEVHERLDALGIIASYRTFLIGNAVAVHCAWWCTGDHPHVITDSAVIGGSGVYHERVLANVVLDTDVVGCDHEITWSLSQYESTEGELEPVLVSVSPTPETIRGTRLQAREALQAIADGAAAAVAALATLGSIETVPATTS